MTITVDGPWFKDEHGRTLLLRGVNLGGSTKVPRTPNGATHLAEGVYDHRPVSFVGRPFPLDQADEHFARLRAWGLTFERLLTTWEAVEHAGPGRYDEAYLDYLHEVVGRAADYGIQVFIDFHQDVWSRFAGGDGAPGWTMEAVGFDLPRLAESGAALLHWAAGDAYPQMTWFSNNYRLAAGTMWALFFAGNDLAPQTRIAGAPAQDYLQAHYMGAMQAVARRLADRPNVVGYDTLNEPSPGWIGQRDLHTYPAPPAAWSWYCPTIFQSMLLGAGYPQEVDFWRFGVPRKRYLGRRTLNPHGVRAWRAGHDPIWQAHGVWDQGPDGQPRLLRPDHFWRVNGREIDFYQDYMRPFMNRVARAVREIDPAAIMFLESDPGDSNVHWGAADAPRVVHAAHWYDAVTLVSKNYYPFLGVDYSTHQVVVGLPGRIRRLYRDNLAHIKAVTRQQMGDIPVLMGEFGVPFDLRRGRAYRTGNFEAQERALDAYCHAMDENLLSWTIWNYTADNDNQWGDQWNHEDLSVFSRDQQDDPADLNSGGRGLSGFVRPYARAIAGEPLRMSFDRQTRRFELSFRHDPAVAAPTAVYVPRIHYYAGCRVTVSDGEYELDPAAQLLTYRHTPDRPAHWLRLERA